MWPCANRATPIQKKAKNKEFEFQFEFECEGMEFIFLTLTLQLTLTLVFRRSRSVTWFGMAGNKFAELPNQDEILLRRVYR